MSPRSIFAQSTHAASRYDRGLEAGAAAISNSRARSHGRALCAQGPETPAWRSCARSCGGLDEAATLSLAAGGTLAVRPDLVGAHRRLQVVRLGADVRGNRPGDPETVPSRSEHPARNSDENTRRKFHQLSRQKLPAELVGALRASSLLRSPWGLLEARLSSSSRTWYASLVKPAWTPPDRWLGPLWTILCNHDGDCTPGSFGRERYHRVRNAALFAYATQLGLNAAWAAVFLRGKKALARGCS